MTLHLGPQLTHDQLASDLAAHLRGSSSRITWEDMQLGPSGSPRPDVYTMEPTYTRLTFEAFECKVSMSDFRADVTAGKWQSYLKYANSVTFAVPHGLISKEMVPAQCGLIVRGPSGQWRYQKKPVRSVLTELPWEAWVKLLIDGTTRASQTLKRDRWSAWHTSEKLAAKHGKEVAEMLSDLQRLPATYEYELKKHKERLQQLEADRTEQRQRWDEQRKAAEARCSDELGELATSLGLPSDALVSDLSGRARQILRLLKSERSRWDRHPLSDMAVKMELLAKDMREVGQLFSQQQEGADA